MTWERTDKSEQLQVLRQLFAKLKRPLNRAIQAGKVAVRAISTSLLNAGILAHSLK
jgi:predicted Fe-S protein YdhL (DUF1289 family)